MKYTATTKQFLNSERRGEFIAPNEREMGIRGSKQYWVLSAIYRMCRKNGLPQSTAATLLNTRAKYDEYLAGAIASLWFQYGRNGVIR